MAEEPPFRKEIDFAYGEAKELAPGIVRLVANNPRPFTYKGTNTYIVGEPGAYAVIDPGPEDDIHVDRIAALVGKDLKYILPALLPAPLFRRLVGLAGSTG